MNEIIKVNYDREQPTVSARDLHEKLKVKTEFKDWFPRMCEYGFTDGKDFFRKTSQSIGGRLARDYDLTIWCAKEICIVQRTEIGRIIQNHFLDLEDSCNTSD